MDGKLRLFDGQTGKLKKTWDDDSARANWITFSPDGKTLLSESMDKTLKVWDVATAKVHRTLKGNEAWVNAVAFSPDGKFLATGGTVVEDNKVKAVEVILWDAKTGELKHAVPDLTVPVSTVAFSPDGRTLAIAGGKVGDVKDGGKTTGEVRIVPFESLTTKGKAKKENDEDKKGDKSGKP
jgi:WD40 repeat protein